MRRVDVREITSLIRATIGNWQEDRGSRLGAALAYYTALSLAPTLLIMLAVVVWAFGTTVAEGRVVQQIQELVGKQGAQVIQTVMQEAHLPSLGRPSHGLTAVLLALVTLFFGASAVVSELRDALNIIWKVPGDPSCSAGRTVWNAVKERLVSFALILSAGSFLFVSLSANVLLSIPARYLRSVAATSPNVSRAADFAISFIAVTALFAFIFKVVPTITLEWADVIAGAVLSSLLFSGGKLLLGVYLTNVGFSDTYGAAGSLIVLLVWIYYSAQMLYLGAEFTHVYASRYGSIRVAGLHQSASKAESFS
jgi:membrane protein